MTILRNLMAIPASVLMVFIDVLFFLTFLRLISHRWRPRWLVALNSKATPAVDWYAGHVERGLRRFSGKIFPERITLFIGMLVLMLVRFTLAALFNT